MSLSGLAPAMRPALLLAGLVAAGAALRLLPGGGAADVLARFAGAHGAADAAAFVVVAAPLCAIGVPRQIVAYAAGYAFGACEGALVAMLAQLLACGGDFFWARLVARDWARRVMQRRWRGRMARFDGLLAAHPFTATLALRLLPVGNNLAVSLLGGLSGVAALPFLAGTALGYVPQTAIFVLVGSGVRVDRTAQIGLGVALFAASAVAGTVLMRRFRTVAPA